MKKIFKGKADKGKVQLDQQDQFNLLVWSLSGKEVELTLSTKKKARSGQQNRYYFGVVIKILSEHTGYSEEEMHDALRMLFLLNRDNKIPTLRSTTELSTISFEEYMSKIRTWASTELDCYVPEPNEVEI